MCEVKVPADLSSSGKAYWKLAPIDACIVDIVEALQAGGIDMRASCCGHNEGPGEILLQDGRRLLVMMDGHILSERSVHEK